MNLGFPSSLPLDMCRLLLYQCNSKPAKHPAMWMHFALSTQFIKLASCCFWIFGPQKQLLHPAQAAGQASRVSPCRWTGPCCRKSCRICAGVRSGAPRAVGGSSWRVQHGKSSAYAHESNLEIPGPRDYGTGEVNHLAFGKKSVFHGFSAEWMYLRMAHHLSFSK